MYRIVYLTFFLIFLQQITIVRNACHTGCTSCSGGSCCNDCRGGHLRSGCTCYCPAGQRTGGYQGKYCIGCPTECSTCNSSACTTCKPGLNRDSNPPCQCQPGFWDGDPYQNDCVPCPANCNKCNNSQCTECQSPFVIMPDNNSCGMCDIDGVYLDGGVCKSCNEGCKTCDNTGKCTGNTCIPGYAFISSTGDCETCDQKCSTCENSTDNCVDCLDATRDVLRQCSCIYGKYFMAPDYSCSQDCPKNCKVCDSNPGICEQCYDENMTLDIDNNTCTCNDGFYDNQSNGCTECNPGCVTCDSGDKCTGSTCQESYFFNPATQICEKCTTQGCRICSPTKDTCVDCYDINAEPRYDCDCKHSFVFNQAQQKCLLRICTRENEILPFCKCRPGFYLNTQSDLCEECQHPCKTCLSLEKCLDCVDESAIKENREKSDQNCVCKPDYFENEEKVCQQCVDSICKSCDNQGICTECRNNLFEPPLCSELKENDQNFADKSKLFTELNQEKRNEIENKYCELQCKFCGTDKGHCLECFNGKFRQSAPSCKCMEGYHDSNGKTLDCEKCPLYCKLCTNSICTECLENYEMDPYTRQCDCRKGFVMDSKAKKCVRCYMYLGKCLKWCPQNTMTNEQDYICVDKNYKELDNIAIIILSLIFILGSISLGYSIVAFCTKKFGILKTPQEKKVRKLENQGNDQGKGKEIYENMDKNTRNLEEDIDIQYNKN